MSVVSLGRAIACAFLVAAALGWGSIARAGDVITVERLPPTPAPVAPFTIADPATADPALAPTEGAKPAGPTAIPAPLHRRKLAIAANTAGFRFHRAAQLPRAAMRFRDATLLDPDYALAHFNLACAASRLRDVSTMVAELSWLATAAPVDPVAQARMRKAAVDPDLDFASALPKVRELLELPPFDPRRPIDWLAERHGTWSAELPTRDCPSRSYTFVFAAEGEAHLTVAENCGTGKAARPRSFIGRATRRADGTVHVDVSDWPVWPGGVGLVFVPCPGLGDAPASCFTLNDGEHDIGPFHRGVAGSSPMRTGTRAAALSPER
jgi:hypothetical protein